MTISTAQLWCRVSELDAARQEIRRLQQRVAELENRPLVAVAPDVAALVAENERLAAEVAALRLENTKLQRRLDAVRELMKSKGVLD